LQASSGHPVRLRAKYEFAPGVKLNNNKMRIGIFVLQGPQVIFAQPLATPSLCPEIVSHRKAN
jgi:hypothetical protein